MGFLTRNWQLKVMALLLSMLLWLILHYGRPTSKKAGPRKAASPAAAVKKDW